MNKTTQTLVVVSSTAAIAFFAYKVYQTYKRVKQEMADADVLATAVLEDLKAPREDIPTPEPVRFIEDEPEILDAPGINGVFISEEEMEEAEDDEIEYVDNWDDIEGVEELRFPKDSEEALHQYKNFVLAGFEPTSKTTQILWKLFKIPFVPTNESDGRLYGYIVSDRENFFGEGSIHEKPSVAEFILYLANHLDFDLDGGAEVWTAWLLGNLGITPGIGEITLTNTLDSLMGHTFNSSKGYGIFAMNDRQYANVLNGRGNTTVRYMTFMAQYHEFVKCEMEQVEKNGFMHHE